MCMPYTSKLHKNKGLYSLLSIYLIFLSSVSFAQVSDVEEIDDRPEILKNFDGSEEEYQKIKKTYYEENGLLDESEDTWSTVSEYVETECDIKFEIPKNINQPSEVNGTWGIFEVTRNGTKDFDKEFGDPTLLHDFNSGNRLILSSAEGKFSHFLTDKSYWNVTGNSLTITSFHKESCVVETIDFTIINSNKDELELNVLDPDGKADVNYDIKLKLIEK